MEMFIRNLTFSLLAGISCQVFFGTLLPRKRRQQGKHLPAAALVMKCLPSLVFAAGFLAIAFSEAPGYLFQPLRVMLILSVILQIFFRAGIGKTILLTAFWCAMFWILNLLAVSTVYAMPVQNERIQGLSDWLCVILLLCLSLVFRYKCKGWSDCWDETGWNRFAWLPVLSLTVTTLMTLSVWYTDSVGKVQIMVVSAGYSVINILVFYFIGNNLEKEAEVQKARLMQIRLKNQMEVIQNIQESDTRYRRYLHDYKNQLGCIQGMLKAGRVTEALGYIEELGVSLRKGEDCINTNHLVVNTVLNQKYLSAQEKGITMVMAVNDLSALAMGKEDVVTLLVNLLDNAVEACEKLDENKVIWFKMMLEEGELTISVRNPVKEPVEIRGKTIRTTKEKKSGHGLGLLNVNSVVERNHGTSVLQCQDGWFCFSAIIPEV